MTKATHIHAYSHTRLRFVEMTGLGKMAIFENIDSPYPARTTCPMTPEYVIPYRDYYANEEKSNVVHLRDIFMAKQPPKNLFHSQRFFA